MKRLFQRLGVLAVAAIMALSMASPMALAQDAPAQPTTNPTGTTQNPAQSGQQNNNAANLNQQTRSFYTGNQISRERRGRYTFDKLISELLPGVATWFATFIGGVAVLFLIWAGVQFLTAEGDEEKIKTASKTALYVVVGVLLAMFAYALVFLFLTIFTA